MGYGNAIVRPLAVAFIESAIESFADAAHSSGFAGAPVAVVTEPQEEDAA
jgi:hypothetical protein